MTSFGISTDAALAAEVLRNGGIIGLPTETVYGLAALAKDETAVHRIFDTKGRPRNHPLIVHLSKSMDFTQWGHFDKTALALAHTFWPGPLTLLVPRTSLVPDWVTGGRDTVAIRVPSHPMAQEILTLVADGVVAPSANRFGRVSPTSALHVITDLGDDVDLVLDGGRSDVGVESTIVECTDVFQILRPGHISEEDISKVSGRVPGTSSGPSRAPGMLESHYAPDAKVILAESLDEAEQLLKELPAHTTKRILHIPNLLEFAENLYNELRRADDDQIEVLIAVKALPEGLGIAINDRLSKASALR
jgi:L-threonylcarbamoyladenylate synthase